MKRILLFVVLLGAGLAILFIGLGNEGIEDIAPTTIPKVNLPGPGASPEHTPVVSVGPEREQVTAENLVKTFRKQITRDDGSAVEVTRYVLKMARGETETQRSQDPELLIYSGEVPGEEQLVIRVTGDEGSVPSSSSAAEQDAAEMRQVDLVGHVVVTFLDPRGVDDLVLATDRLSVYPERPDDPDSKLLLHCPSAIEIAKSSRRLSIRGASLHADLAEQGMTIGGPVVVTGSDFSIPALDGLLSASPAPRQDAAEQLPPDSPPVEPIRIESQGEMAFIPDPVGPETAAVTPGGTLSAGRFLFADGVSVSRAEEWIRGERLEIRVAPVPTEPAGADSPSGAQRKARKNAAPQKNRTPSDGKRHPRRRRRSTNSRRGSVPAADTATPSGSSHDLTIASFVMSSPPGSLTTFDTAMTEGECRRIEWERTRNRLELVGRPELRVASGSPARETGMTDRGAAPRAPGQDRQSRARRVYRLTARGRILVEPEVEKAGAGMDPGRQRSRVHLIEAAAVRDSQGQLTLEAGEIEALVERAESASTPGAGEEWRLTHLIARPSAAEPDSDGPVPSTTDRPHAVLEAADFSGERIEIFPGETAESPPRVQVTRLDRLDVALETEGARPASRFIVEPLDEDCGMRLEASGALFIDGRSRSRMPPAGAPDRPEAGDRTLLADHIEVPPRAKDQADRKAADATLHARGNVDLVEAGSLVHLQGRTLDVPIAPAATRTVLQLTGAPARLAQGEGDPGREMEVLSPRIDIELADGAVSRIDARDGATSSFPASLLDVELVTPAGAAPAAVPSRESERVTLNAREVSIYSGDDPRQGPQRLVATGGVRLESDASRSVAFGKDLTFDLVSRSGTLIGDPDAGLPAEVTWYPDGASRPDRIEGPRIEIEDSGHRVRVPEAGQASVQVRETADGAGPGSGRLLVVACQGEMILEEERLVARDTVRAQLSDAGEVYRLHARDAVVSFHQDPASGERRPERLVAQGQVRLESNSVRGLGDILVATYPWEAVTLEGRGRPCWIERQDGGLLQAAVIDVNTQTERIRARRGDLSARAR